MKRCIGLLLLAGAAGAGSLPDLPVAVTNNAVATVVLADGTHVVSLMGLRAGKTWRDTTSAAWHLPPGAKQWRSLPDVPGGDGRLAGVAVGVNGLIYVFGGYTVAADETERSVPLVHSLDAVSGVYHELAPMPVPVDDTVAVSYRDRYVYLVSGWHDTGNVNLVQLYDTETDSWSQATPWPAASLFGHAGAIAGEQLVICDGVKIRTTRSQRQFAAARQCLLGKIRPGDLRRVDWSLIPHHPGPPLYRMAATGGMLGDRPVILFAGGSDNPYNYNGIGYNGRPSAGSTSILAWLVEEQRWQRIGRLPVASMDHRGLLRYGDGYVIVGGMRDGQRVTAEVMQFSVP